jgi:hypothetical protein
MPSATSSSSRRSARPRKKEGVIEAKHGDPGPLGVADRVPGQRGQLVLGLLGPTLVLGGLGGHIAGCEAGAFLDRSSGKTLGQSVVVARPGRDRPR